MSEITEVLVCQAGPCRMAGSEAVLLEIEELGNAVGHCRVQPSGCLGYCRQAPNALVLKNGRLSEEVHVRIDRLEKSVEVVKSATGKNPPVDDPVIQSRLSGVRLIRQREAAIRVHKWNSALKALTEEIGQLTARGERPSPELFSKHFEVQAKAGFPGGLIPLNEATVPDEIDMYTQWSIESVKVVSKHSAIFRFRSKDRKRYTPNPRGGGRALPNAKTWHTTLLGLAGPNPEGPLPWVERDYTPISTAKEWESGLCDILIKIYPDGVATSWLNRILTAHNPQLEDPLRVWLSRPVQTLSVPSLVEGATSFRPNSVLLLLAGTGVVAIPQLLQHRDPTRKLGISTRRTDQLHVPIDLILSCRSDDVLMLPEITQACREATEYAVSKPDDAPVIKGLRECTLLLTGTAPPPDGGYPFPNFEGSGVELELDELQGLPNAQVLHTRLTEELVSKAMSKMTMPCRIVVSGPTSFNVAARAMLVKNNVDSNAITILEA